MTENLVVSLVVAVVTAILTVHLSFRNFRKEKWWERRADAYSTIIESLHYMRVGLDREIEERQRIDPPPENEITRDASRKFREARERLEKAIDMSVFLLSDEAVGILQELRAGFGKAMADASVENGRYLDVDSLISGEFGAVERCLGRLPYAARRDLGINAHRWRLPAARSAQPDQQTSPTAAR